MLISEVQCCDDAPSTNTMPYTSRHLLEVSSRQTISPSSCLPSYTTESTVQVLPSATPTQLHPHHPSVLSSYSTGSIFASTASSPHTYRYRYQKRIPQQPCLANLLANFFAVSDLLYSQPHQSPKIGVINQTRSLPSTSSNASSKSSKRASTPPRTSYAGPSSNSSRTCKRPLRSPALRTHPVRAHLRRRHLP